MEAGVWYRVTKGSADGTFIEGDTVKLLKDGSILCKEAGGWIDVEDVAAASQGMEVKLLISKEEQSKMLEAQIKMLEAQIQKLKSS